MAEFPAFPLYTDALLADCGHLTDAEFGLYLRLLIQMWRSPSSDGCVPDDDSWLAKRFGKTPEVVAAELRPLIAEFCQKRPGGKVTQRRLQRELENVRKYRAKQSQNAKSLWNKKKGISHGMSLAYAIGGIGLASDSHMHAHAMHPNKKERKKEGDEVPRKEEGLPASKEARKEAPPKSAGGPPIQVSAALAAKYTAPRRVDDGFAHDLEIPAVLRRTA